MSSKDTARINIVYRYSITYGIPSSCASGFEDDRSQSYSEPCQLGSSGAQSSTIKHHSPEDSTKCREGKTLENGFQLSQERVYCCRREYQPFERYESPKPLILSPVTNTQFQLVQREVVIDGYIITLFETHLTDVVVDPQSWK